MTGDRMIFDSARRPPAYLEELRQLYRYRSLIGELIARDIKTRYKRSLLGIAWTMLNPLLTMLVLALIFSSIFRFTFEHYVVYLLSGLLIWQLLAQTTTYAMGQMVWGGDLLRKIYFPRTAFAVSSIGTGLVNLGLSLIPLLLIMLLTGVALTPALLLLPIGIVLTAMFSLGIGLFLSSLAVYYTDVLSIYEILLMIWMYLTPIIYPLEALPEGVRRFVSVNPMSGFVELFRQPILNGTPASLSTYGWSTLLALISLLAGWIFFTRQADAIAYHV
jgi:ABC-type polysaccharide/polyol phosphate export permease